MYLKKIKMAIPHMVLRRKKETQSQLKYCNRYLRKKSKNIDEIMNKKPIDIDRTLRSIRDHILEQGILHIL